MSNGEQRPQSQSQASTGGVWQDDIDAGMRPRETARTVTDAKPAWLDHFVWGALWKFVAVAIATALLLLLARELRHLLWLLVVSSFFALAMIPGVEQIHRRWGWRRGAAVGVIYVSVAAFFVLMVLVLIPAIEQFADQVRANGGGWIDQMNDLSREWLGTDLVGEEAGDRAAVVTQASLRGWSDNVLGLASSGIGKLFDVAVVAMFAFYFSADYPRIERALLSRMSPDRQHVYAWVSQVSIQRQAATSTRGSC
jgi:predicted PurR-regulated permease PerM